VINLLTPSKSTPAGARGFLSRIAAAVTSLRAPAAEVAAAAISPNPSTDGVPPADLPELPEIEAAAAAYAKASEQAREADRAKRKARKTLDGLETGTYGAWRVFRKSSARVTPDMERIAAIFKAHGLGEIPTRPVADSLVVERVVDTTPDAGLAEAELLALAGAR
jgi:hypothetical protein